ncbi:MAG: hypothetical protein FJX74_16295 [Armatimonadetes bacterium]|nr:hypothetical protein [Armatimonadota bacterium]
MQTDLRRRGTPRVVPAALLATLGLMAAPAFAQGAGGTRQLVGLLILPALAAASGALQGVLAVAFPRWTAATRRAVEERRGLCLLWGFLILLFVLIVTLILSAVAEPLAGVGALLLLLALLLSLAGYIGLAAAVGASLVPGSLDGADHTPRQALTGGLTLCFACLVPVIGQVLGLALLFASIGATAVALFGRGDGPAA